MRKIILIISFLLISCPLMADIKVQFVSGDVKVFQKGAWKKAEPSEKLNKSDKIKTSLNSNAILDIDNKSQLWINENSEISIDSLGKDNFFDLLAGKVRAKVTLSGGQKFRVKTPVSVASVRGTDFVLTFEGILAVLEGKVEFSDAMMKQVVEVLQGQWGEFDDKGKASSRDMTPQDKSNIENEWKLFFEYKKAQAESAQGKKDKDDLRKEIREIVMEVKNDIRITREYMNEIKESDMSAGRTLKDSHGNLVRVEQHLLRPDQHTMQIVNLTKRSFYQYKDHGMGILYNGPTGSRLDVIDCQMTMNFPLPDQLSEWPGYIASKGDDMHPESVSVKFTNLTDTIESRGEWQKKGYVKPNNEVLNDDQLVFSSYVNGWKVNDAYVSPDREVHKDGSDSGELWEWRISPQKEIIDPANPANKKYVKFYEESFVINNGGGIMNMNNFTNSSENPFRVLKEASAQQIFFCRETNGKDFLRKGNIDVVAIPDVFVSAALQMATQIGDLKSSDSKDSSDNSN